MPIRIKGCSHFRIRGVLKRAIEGAAHRSPTSFIHHAKNCTSHGPGLLLLSADARRTCTLRREICRDFRSDRILLNGGTLNNRKWDGHNLFLKRLANADSAMSMWSMQALTYCVVVQTSPESVRWGRLVNLGRAIVQPPQEAKADSPALQGGVSDQ